MCVQECVSLFHISFCYVPFTMLTKSVDRWTSNEKLKTSSNLFYFHSLKVWTFVEETVILFHIFFLSFLYPSIFCKKVWTGGQVRKILKKASISFIFLLENLVQTNPTQFLGLNLRVKKRVQLNGLA